MITSSGSFKNTTSFLESLQRQDFLKDLDKWAREGVRALSNATPQETGLASRSWDYEIEHTSTKTSIWWTNSNVEGGASVVILLQYGHGTGTGGYVQGRDFINPAMESLFSRIADDVWKRITKL